MQMVIELQLVNGVLNDSRNKVYFLASDVSTIIDKVTYHHNKSVEEKPLILKDEVKDTSISQMPF